MNGGSEQLEYVKVQDLVKKYFKKADDKNKMVAITEKGLSDAIQEFIEKDEKDAIAELINYQINKIQTYLKNEVTWQNEFQLEEEIRNFQKIRLANVEDEEKELREVFEKTRKNTQSNTRVEGSDEESPFSRKAYDSDEEIGKEKTGSGRGRGSTRSRGRATRTTRGGRGAKISNQEEISFMKSSSRTAIKSEKINIDSDEDIITLDQKVSKPVRSIATTSSVRRARINYDDDEDEYMSSTKKTKINESKLDDDDDIPNTFSIFKKVARKK